MACRRPRAPALRQLLRSTGAAVEANRRLDRPLHPAGRPGPGRGRSSAHRSSGAGRVAELVVTRGYVAADHADRLASERSSGRRVLSRLERSRRPSRALPPSTQRSSRRNDRPEQDGAAGDARQPDQAPAAERARGVGDRAADASRAGMIVHVECGDGALVKAAGGGGYRCRPAPIRARDVCRARRLGGRERPLVRAGAFEFLGGCCSRHSAVCCSPASRNGSARAAPGRLPILRRPASAPAASSSC